jgi:biotin-(acetyl-CoA carboxylase) ligase
MRHAVSIASEHGAGTLVWVRRFDTLEMALVLEPEEPLAEARRAIYPAMSAMADALAAHCPPEKPLDFAWPDTIRLDGGILGGARLAWPDSAAEDEVPEWLVIGMKLRTVIALAASGSNRLDQAHTLGTSLEAEGFEMMDQAALIESFARHFMVHVDVWREQGFVPVGQNYLARLREESGVRRGIDKNGDLLVRRLNTAKAVERRSLVAALAARQWLDPETEEPLL